MLKFIPPRKHKLPRYASYGNGVMKTHVSVGAAKQSLSHRVETYKGWGEGFILELVDGEWFILYHVKDGTATDDLPWKKRFWYRGYGYYGSSRYFVKPTWIGESDLETATISVPMTKDEYAEWRVKVELEKRGITE